MKISSERKRTHCFTKEDILTVRRAMRKGDKTQRQIAREYGMSDGYVSLLKNRKRRSEFDV